MLSPDLHRLISTDALPPATPRPRPSLVLALLCILGFKCGDDPNYRAYLTKNGVSLQYFAGIINVAWLLMGIIVVVLMQYDAQRLYGYGKGNLVGVV